MPRILSISLIAVFLLIIGRPFAPFIEYSLGKSTIIRELCENRDRPSLKCNGKCYLSKQLRKAAQENDADNPFQVRQMEEIAQYLPTNGFLSFRIFQESDFNIPFSSFMKNQWKNDPLSPPPRIFS